MIGHMVLKDKNSNSIGSELRAKEANSATIKCMFLNLILTIIKILIGITGKSTALVADGFHSLSDFGSDIAVLLGFRAAKKPKDECHNYGHGKFETLTTIIIGLALLGAATMILISGAGKIMDALDGETLEQPGWIALVTAFIAIVIKEWMYRYTVKIGRRINSKLLIANAWHHRTDALSSVGAVLGIGGAIVLGGEWRVLDPVAAVLVSLFIARIAVNLIRESTEELLEKSLDKDTVDDILRIIQETNGVIRPHNLRTRQIGNCIAVDVHIRVRGNLSVARGHDIASDVERGLRDRFGEETIISIHVEPHKKKK